MKFRANILKVDFKYVFINKLFHIHNIIIIIILARRPEIGQGLGRILSCGAREPEQT